MSPSHRFETAWWSVELPHGVLGDVVTKPPPELTTMAIARGWTSGDVPMSVILSTRPKVGGLRNEARRLAGAFMDAPEPRSWSVPGARHAYRMDGAFYFEEALSPEGVEAMTVVVALARRTFVTLTVRRAPPGEGDAEAEGIVSSFEIPPAVAG